MPSVVIDSPIDVMKRVVSMFESAKTSCVIDLYPHGRVAGDWILDALIDGAEFHLNISVDPDWGMVVVDRSINGRCYRQSLRAVVAAHILVDCVGVESSSGEADGYSINLKFSPDLRDLRERLSDLLIKGDTPLLTHEQIDGFALDPRWMRHAR
ncbi:hypothetical protein SH668x_001230 [Planctomicrobium sp. SH668]|uniref:hypothetical protein n=1 Tax=Planctomicrobium sp. SH668 TaxID=3448126 RepID=UPI003F5C7415